MIYTQNNIVRGLVGRDNTIFVMEESCGLATFGYLKINLEGVFIDTLSFLNSNLTIPS